MLKRGLYEGIGLVGEESRVSESELSNGRAMITSEMWVAIQTDVLGNVLPRQIHGGTIDITGEHSIHKCVRIEGSETGLSDTCKDPPTGQSSLSEDNI